MNDSSLRWKSQIALIRMADRWYRSNLPRHFLLAAIRTVLYEIVIASSHKTQQLVHHFHLRGQNVACSSSANSDAIFASWVTRGKSSAHTLTSVCRKMFCASLIYNSLRPQPIWNLVCDIIYAPTCKSTCSPSPRKYGSTFYARRISKFSFSNVIQVKHLVWSLRKACLQTRTRFEWEFSLEITRYVGWLQGGGNVCYVLELRYHFDTFARNQLRQISNYINVPTCSRII